MPILLNKKKYSRFAHCRACKLCNICLEDHNNKVNWISLYCSHKFHHECIIAWKEENKKCPICNTEISIISDSFLSINI